MSDTNATHAGLYRDAPDPVGYQQTAGAGRPVSSRAQSYAPVRLGKGSLLTGRVLLFTMDNYPEQGMTYEGTIPEVLPAKHYAQLLLDMAEYGQVYAEAKMINAVMGEENLRALAASPDVGPEDLKKIMAEAYVRAMGPYEGGLGKGQNA